MTVIFEKIKDLIEHHRHDWLWQPLVYVKDVLWKVSEHPIVRRLFQKTTTTVASMAYRPAFRSVQTFCMFIGYSRSGHSLVGSLIDAHPDAIIAQELNVLEYVRRNFSKNSIYYLLIRNSRSFTRQGRQWGEYPYFVKDQWQGRYRTLQVIGDKKGDFTTRLLRSEPELMERIRAMVAPARMKFIHVIRNPFDNISTMAYRGGFGLDMAIDHYFTLADTVASFKQHAFWADILDVHHDELVADPRAVMRRICSFLQLDCSDEYLNACAGIVWPDSHRTRHNAAWTPELIDEVQQRIAGNSFLSRYTYE